MPANADYVRSVLDAFCESTGRLCASPADYQQAHEWQALGIPLTVVQKGIADKLERTGVKHYRNRMPLSWCHDDVLEVFVNWRRAVGPRRPLQVDGP